jgi:hypothetical protein
MLVGMCDRADRENPVHQQEAKTDGRRGNQKKAAEHEQRKHGCRVMICEPSHSEPLGEAPPAGIKYGRRIQAVRPRRLKAARADGV